MSVKYKLVQRPNIHKPNAPKKYYASIKRRSTLTTKDLAIQLSQRSTLAEGDVWAVLVELTRLMEDKLHDGHVIKIDNFGSFKLQVSSTGADSPESFDTRRHITNKSVLFSVDKAMKQSVQHVTLERMSEK